ncbi:hypothetical protein L227DRAFT_611820 [Lentinus tigrinus ALCF2SS1-6]|uniref:Uncharacterized protein n=1 Tax=Lentinus tigrinus ALCF2SS1-6 TaxID=1328759 RepID=A0A5C2S8U7_9APHY|nr:hypothetical protein L227DRAFT_611820 [Lentinus tigrinus ALCF2SS1-6]
MSSGRKPRYALFSVGRNKASPARTASVKRASLRASVVRTEAPKLHLAFQGERDAAGCKPPANPAPSLTTRDISRPQPESSPDNMKDTPLPSLPSDSAPARKPRELAFHPPPETRPPRPPPTSTMSPPERQSGPSRAPRHSVTMPQPTAPPQQGNFFRRLTSKIRSSAPHHNESSQTQPHSQPSHEPKRKGTILRLPSLPKAPPPAAPPNDFTSAEQRQAALRARGLIPASSTAQRRFRDAEGFMMPLSEQEAEIDRRFAVVVPRTSFSEDEDASGSEARKIREAWLAKQHAATGDSSQSQSAGESASGHDATSTSDDSDEAPRKSDAIARASKDGTMGDKSPARATFVRATTLSPNMGEIVIGGGSVCVSPAPAPSPPPPGSPLEATVEDFHTAPNTPSRLEDVLSARHSASADRPRAASPPAPTPTPARVPPNSTATVGAAHTHAHTHSQEPSTPSSHSSAVTEKVSRWLRTSSDTPVSPTASSSAPILSPSQTHSSPLSESPRQSLDETQTQTPVAATPTPTGTVRARKEKPPPIIVTAHRSTPDSHSHPKVPQAAQVLALTIAAPSDSEASTEDEGRPSLETRTRGRGLHVHVSTGAGPPRLAHDISTSSDGTTTNTTTYTTTTGGSAGTGTGTGATTTSGRSRTNTVPALSPTRTVSSSGASSALPTPTTTSCAPMRDASISRGSTSQSSDGGHGETRVRVRARRGTTGGEMGANANGNGNGKAKARERAAGGVIMEEYSETEPSSEGGEGGGEFGVPPVLPPKQEGGGGAGGPRLRPQPSGRAQMLEAQTKAGNRISFSLFGKKSLDSSPVAGHRSPATRAEEDLSQMPSRDTRTSSSMMSLRRAFTSSKPRPKSTLELSPVAEQSQGQGVGRKKSKMFDASHLPAIPTSQPQSQSQSQSQSQYRRQHHQATSSVSSDGKTTGVGLRPRQAVAPTIHSRGSILHQAHFIEDEESRRLSEMAFLT